MSNCVTLLQRCPYRGIPLYVSLTTQHGTWYYGMCHVYLRVLPRQILEGRCLVRRCPALPSQSRPVETSSSLLMRETEPESESSKQQGG